MGFVDVTAQRQAREDARSQKRSQDIQSIFDTYQNAYDKNYNRQLAQNERESQTKRERAMRAMEKADQMRMMYAQNNGRAPTQDESYQIDLAAGVSLEDAGKNDFNKGSALAGLYDAIGKRSQEDRNYKRSQDDLDNQLKRATINEKLSQTQSGLPKLGGEEKKAIGGIAEGFKSLTQIENALNSGVSPQYLDANTPFVGKLMSDNDLTSAQRVLSDVVGRLQSGGAINKDEEKRFMDMGPRPGDTPEVRLQKIGQQRSFLSNKLKAYGLDESGLVKAGFDVGSVNNKAASNGAPKGFDVAQIPGDQVQIPYAPTQNAPGINNAYANPGNFTPEKKSRLEQLRAKAGMK